MNFLANSLWWRVGKTITLRVTGCDLDLRLRLEQAAREDRKKQASAPPDSASPAKADGEEKAQAAKMASRTQK